MDDNTHFFIIATGWNCEKYVKRCIDSVRAQTYENYTAVFMDDGSTDGTNEAIEDNVQKGTENKTFSATAIDNMGAACRRFEVLKLYNLHQPNSVVLLLGLDDYLLPNALERIKQEYDNGAWMTYGNWRGTDGYELPEGFLHYHDGAHRTRDYRAFKYRATAPNTFKAHLFDHFTEDDFKFEGEWIKATTESNLMLSLLEMCGKDRIGVIEDVIYIYENNRKDKAAWRFGREYQDRIYKHVKRLPKRDLI